jgi:hypothetical protein
MDMKRVYFAQFSHRETDTKFVKVGMSASALSQRFASDLSSYEVRLLAETEYYTASDARIVESNIQQMMAFAQVRPPVPLRSGGNTECFRFSRDVVERILRIMTGRVTQDKPIRKQTQPSKERKVRRYPKPTKVEIAVQFNTLSLHKQRASTTLRTSRDRPDAGVMLKGERERGKNHARRFKRGMNRNATDK